MRKHLTLGHDSGAGLAVALLLMAGCRPSGMIERNASSSVFEEAFPPLSDGLRIDVILPGEISSGSAQVGDHWQGTVSDAAGRQVGDLIPGGSLVTGDVVAVRAAGAGSPAMLELELTSVRLDGAERPLRASAEAVTAASPSPRGAGAADAVAAAHGPEVVLQRGRVMRFMVGQPAVSR
jgi:hypothetical protein